MSKKPVHRFPELPGDIDVEAFVAEADLTDYDWSDMKPVRFKFAASDTTTVSPLEK